MTTLRVIKKNRTAAPSAIRYKGTEYRLVSAAEEDEEAVSPPSDEELDAIIERHEEKKDKHKWRQTQGPTKRETREWLEKVGPEVAPKMLPPSEGPEQAPYSREVYVRMSKDDFNLLDNLPQEETQDSLLLDEFIDRIDEQKFEKQRAEVLASEDEIRAVVKSLKQFVDTSNPDNPHRTHAQDMASFWEHNYLRPAGKPRSKPLYEELPRGPGNVRMFSYKGALYVRVADERETKDYMGKKESPTLTHTIDNEAYGDMLSSIARSLRKTIKNTTEEGSTVIPKAVLDNVPLAVIKNTIDRVGHSSTALHVLHAKMNNDREPGPRWLTDAFFWSKGSKLYELVDDPDLVRACLNKYIEELEDFRAAAEVALKDANDMLSHAVNSGFVSKWSADKPQTRDEARRRIIEVFYGWPPEKVDAYMASAFGKK